MYTIFGAIIVQQMFLKLNIFFKISVYEENREISTQGIYHFFSLLVDIHHINYYLR